MNLFQNYIKLNLSIALAIAGHNISIDTYKDTGNYNLLSASVTTSSREPTHFYVKQIGNTGGNTISLISNNTGFMFFWTEKR